MLPGEDGTMGGTTLGDVTPPTGGELTTGGGVTVGENLTGGTIGKGEGGLKVGELVPGPGPSLFWFTVVLGTGIAPTVVCTLMAATVFVLSDVVTVIAPVLVTALPLPGGSAMGVPPPEPDGPGGPGAPGGPCPPLPGVPGGPGGPGGPVVPPPDGEKLGTTKGDGITTGGGTGPKLPGDGNNTAGLASPGENI
jgi:hypothetical protein